MISIYSSEIPVFGSNRRSFLPNFIGGAPIHSKEEPESENGGDDNREPFAGRSRWRSLDESSPLQKKIARTIDTLVLSLLPKEEFSVGLEKEVGIRKGPVEKTGKQMPFHPFSYERSFAQKAEEYGIRLKDASEVWASPYSFDKIGLKEPYRFKENQVSTVSYAPLYQRKKRRGGGRWRYRRGSFLGQYGYGSAQKSLSYSGSYSDRLLRVDQERFLERIMGRENSLMYPSMEKDSKGAELALAQKYHSSDRQYIDSNGKAIKDTYIALEKRISKEDLKNAGGKDALSLINSMLRKQGYDSRIELVSYFDVEKNVQRSGRIIVDGSGNGRYFHILINGELPDYEKKPLDAANLNLNDVVAVLDHQRDLPLIEALKKNGQFHGGEYVTCRIEAAVSGNTRSVEQILFEGIRDASLKEEISKAYQKNEIYFSSPLSLASLGSRKISLTDRIREGEYIEISVRKNQEYNPKLYDAIKSLPNTIRKTKD